MPPSPRFRNASRSWPAKPQSSPRHPGRWARSWPSRPSAPAKRYLRRADAGVSLSAPGVLRAVAGAGLYLAAVGLLGFALGTLIRHTAGALSAFFAVLFAPSIVVDILPTTWHTAINYMPANAGSQIFAVAHADGALPPWTGLGLLFMYIALLLLAAVTLMQRRDV